ncbi:MAG: MSH system pilin adhesin MshQ [Idiomarinaceae bacterium HL-53]|nr:MAG: MSH system pilin adhesin MshQ [Idiomarinaceae bacterium HL-53]CUS47448.1 MSHA biogenesis protein MshQ [Idiomarinaceae bacterium HL-53]
MSVLKRLLKLAMVIWMFWLSPVYADYELPNINVNSGPFQGCTISIQPSGTTIQCPSNLIIQNNDPNDEITIDDDFAPITLSIAGDFTFKNNFEIDGDGPGTLSIIVGGNLNPGNSAEINANLTVSGSVNVSQGGSEYEGDLVIGGNLNLGNNAEIDGNIVVSGTLNGGNGLEINGNIQANSGVNLGNGSEIEGDIVSDGDVNIGNDSVIDGNINTSGNVNNNGEVTGYINASAVNGGGSAGETCDQNSNIGPCSGGSEGPSDPIDFESTLPMCTDIWAEMVRADNTRYPESNYVLPEEALSGDPLPQNMSPIDYLRRGNFGSVGQNWQPTGDTARVYIDGDLRIQSGRRLNQGGDPERLILVVTGTLEIEPDVRINGYIFAEEEILFIGRSSSGQARARVTGGLVSNGGVLQETTPVSANPILTFDEPDREIQGGRFCLGQPRQEMWLRFSDQDWSTTFGSVDDSSESETVIISQANGFSFPSSPLDVRAVNTPTYVDGGADSALVADSNTGFLGTCSFANFESINQQFFEAEDNFRLNFKGSFTIGTWLYLDNLPSSGLMTIASKNENYEFHVRSDGRLNWWWNNDQNQVVQFNSSFTLPTQQWLYVGIRYTPSTQTIFTWNGSNLQTTNLSNDEGLRNVTAPLQIGSDQELSGRYLNGRIDEFRVFKGALTNTELENLAEERVSSCGASLSCTADDFSSQIVFNNQWQTERSSGSFTPQINNGRLRLTEATNNQATVAALRQAFPAVNNYLEVTFDFNAYASNNFGGSTGGDGIAIVFSDATEVPIPGSYGGSLGYAQRALGGVPGPGFQGGWLGIGLDVYGNFSQATEGRVGGLGLPLNQTRSRVALRGAEETNYQFITASSQLSGMSSFSTTPPPSDRYKIIIDSRISDSSFITVLRKRPSDPDFVAVVPEFDIYDILPAQQPVVPELLRLSFTGSTGGAFSVHEMDNIEVCALASQPIGAIIDHIRLSHSGELVSCFSETLEVRACLNDDCTQTLQDPSEVILQASAGSWSNVSEVDGANATIELNNGDGNANLNNPSGGTVNFSLVGSSPITTSNDPLRCYINALSGVQVPCEVIFTNAGLAFVDPNDIDQLDSAPITAGVDFTKALRVVETNTVTGACEARVENQSLPVQLSYSCLNPNMCISGQSFSVNGTQIDSSTDTQVNLEFNQDGVAVLGTGTSYDDVGQVRLNAELVIPENLVSGEPEITVEGASLPFVSKPHTLRVFALNANNTIRNMAQVDEPAYVAAGESFSVIVASENAQGELTPNFGKETPTVSVNAEFIETVYPVTGVPGTLTSGTSFIASAIDGALISESLTWSEVGSFTMRAALAGNSYLGAGDAFNRPADVIGRFYPFQFEITESALTNSCNGVFSYLDEPALGVEFTVEAQNSGGVVTQNYSAGYAEKAEFSIFAMSGMDDLSDRLSIPDSPVNTWILGELNYSTFEASLSKSATEIDGPWPDTQISIGIQSERDDRFDLIGGSASSFLGGLARELSGELNLIYGRLRLNNVFAPEGERLQVDAIAEYWDGFRFVQNLEDSCTLISPSNLNIVANPLGLNLSEGPVPNSQQFNLFDGESVPNSLYWQPNTDNSGEFEFEYEMNNIPWLRFPWSSGLLENPTALGTFGSFRGNDRVIYLLERRLN